MDTLKIATFNVNGIQTRLAALLAWLEREAPDIVCLQELKTPDARFPAAALEKAGYGAIWQGQSAWNGVAILARDSQPLEVRRGLPGNASDPHSRYLEAVASTACWWPACTCPMAIPSRDRSSTTSWPGSSTSSDTPPS